MTTPCDRFRHWLDEDGGTEPDALEQKARAEHLLECPDCREEMKGIVVQRSTVRGVFQSNEPRTPLSEALVKKCVNAMMRAARDGEGLQTSAG